LCDGARIRVGDDERALDVYEADGGLRLLGDHSSFRLDKVI